MRTRKGAKILECNGVRGGGARGFAATIPPPTMSELPEVR